MKVGIYVRVSTQEQAKEGYSIPTQIRLLEMYCESQGWSNFEVYADEGFSAKDTNRPNLKRLRKDIEKGRVKILLVYRLDRLTRSVRDLYDILSFLDEHGCAFRSATENYDTTSAMGRMFIGLIALLAQWERENLGERVAVNLQEKVLVKKEPVGIQPFGYRYEGKNRVIDEEEKKVIFLMIELFEKHSSISTVVRELNKRGLRTRRKTPWHHIGVRDILRNPALYGAMVFNGEIVDGISEGILTKEEYDLLQRKLNKQSIVRTRGSKKGLFSGLLKCHQCGNTLVKSEKIYRCNRCYEKDMLPPKANEKKVEEAFMKYIKNLELIPGKVETKKKDEVPMEIQLKKLEEKRSRLQRMYADEYMTYEEFTKSMSETQKEMELLMLRHDEEEIEVREEDLRNFKSTILKNYDYLTYEEKVEFLSLFVKHIDFHMIVSQYTREGKPYKYDYVIDHVEFQRVITE